jgi:F-type H+-transporting ATPase subunit b
MIQVGWGLVFTIINLLLLFVLMKLFLFKPVQKILEARQAEADRQFAEAAEKQSQADEMKSRYEESLVNTEAEKKQVLLEARKSADAEYQRIVQNAENEASQIKTSATEEAESRKAQILKQAEKEIADMVMDAAVKVVGEKSGAGADAALYDKFLDKAGDEA